jgi:hypothetical protein
MFDAIRDSRAAGASIHGRENQEKMKAWRWRAAQFLSETIIHWQRE